MIIFKYIYLLFLFVVLGYWTIFAFVLYTLRTFSFKKGFRNNFDNSFECKPLNMLIKHIEKII